MANTTKKSNGRKSNSSAKKGAATRKKNAQKAQRRKKVVTEVYLWIFVAVALLLILSNFGLCGIVGNAFKDVMMGLFGTMGYVFPVILTVTAGLIAYNRMNTKIVSKIIAADLTYVDLCLFFHLISYGNTQKNFVYFYTEGADGVFGGGMIGGFFGKIICSLLGITGAYIVTILVLIICVVILTEKSIMSAIKNRGQNVYENAREESKLRKEESKRKREENLQEKEQRRLERRRERTAGVGVKFEDTTIKPEQSKPDKRKDNLQEVHEIHIEGMDDVLETFPEQDHTMYTYHENTEKSLTTESPEREAATDSRASDGIFQPKERIILSEGARETMQRKPFQVGKSSEKETKVNDDLPISEESVEKVPEKMASEGKIIAPAKRKLKYKKPPYTLLKDSARNTGGTTKASLMQTANKLKQVLANFGVKVEVTNVSKGPSVTRYELQPEMGTKVSRITGLADDIKLNMAAADIRIEAPIPGKAAVGIEIPNERRDSVCLKELLMSKELREHKSKLAFPAGKDIAGKVVVADIAKMPHMLIAGTTGSGKSVFTNSILMSILYRTTPEEVRLIVIDPKVVEFQVYNKIPHLLYDVVTDPKKAAGILNWAVAEMTTRYKKFAKAGARDISSYNAKAERGDYPEEEPLEKMPQILIVIDELADLMMVAAKEVEEAICRLAQLARAAGIHMVIATQRPSVDVITGLIKANIPSRVALTVASGTDSRTIIDMNGAEKLLGNGDMLFYPAGYVKPVRVQGAYVSDIEIRDTVEYIRKNSGEAEYDETIDAKLVTDQEAMANGGERDPYFIQAGRLCIEKQKGSTSMIQRQFKVGFNRAARIMDQLYEAGVVGQEEQNKPRKIIISMEEFEQMIQN